MCACQREFDGLGPETRAACALHGHGSHMSLSVLRIQPRRHPRQVDSARLSARVPNHDHHLSASELVCTILTEMLSTPSNLSRLESVYAVGVIWDSRQRAERSCICTM